MLARAGVQGVLCGVACPQRLDYRPRQRCPLRPVPNLLVQPASKLSRKNDAYRLRALAKRDARVVAKEVQQEDVSPFFEPFVRSMLLGIGVGGLVEAVHGAMGLLNQLGTHASEVLPRVSEEFGPLFAADHVAALGFWLIFYVIEAVAIYSVLQSHPDDKEAAARAIKKLSTLPKRLAPNLRTQIFKQLLLGNRFSAGRALPAASAFVDDGPLFPSGPTSEQSSFSPAGLIQAPRPPMPEPPMEEENKPTNVREAQDLASRRMKEGLAPGQLDADIARFMKRQKELQDRRLYLKNFWYAAAISEKVQETPVGVEILGEKLVLFRGKDGKVVCISDVCPHRGAPLHKGWVTEMNGHDCIVCPYHGWAFDGDGKLQDVPASEKQDDWPHKPVLSAYDVEEKGGFVWLYYGHKQMPRSVRPPIPHVPELEDPRWRPVYGEIEFDCGHWSVFENAIDMAHIHYLHDDTFGNQEKPEIKDMKVREDTYSVTATFKLHNKPVRGWEWSTVPEVNITAMAMLPSTSVIAFTLGNGLSFTTFVNTVPISANRSVNRFALIRNLDTRLPGVGKAFNMGVWDKMARNAMLRILGEDKAMVEQLRPDLLVREVNVKADKPQVAFRKLRQQWIDLGYGVLPEGTSEGFRGDF